MEGTKDTEMQNNKSLEEESQSNTLMDLNKSKDQETQVIQPQQVNMVVKDTVILDSSNNEISAESNTEEKQDVQKAEVFDVSNRSLCNLLVYSSGDSSSSSSSDSESDSDDSSSSSSSDVEEVTNKPVSETSAAKKNNKKKSMTLLETLKSLGELSIDDLPPVPDVSSLSIKVEDCQMMGKVSSIVDKLVMVESIPNMPAYDIDTLLFINNGKQPLGYIFDVIGAVTSPMYAIRFNSVDEIKSLNVTKGLPVFSAPKSEHTQYVFVQQLMQAKGSDASWSNDLEVPQEFVDYSDDEAECSRKNSFRGENRKHSRLHKIRDNTEPMNKKQTTNSNYKRPQQQYQPNGYWPNVGYSHANASNQSCAFPYGMPPYMQPFRPQGMPPFVPPANFAPNVYPPLPNVPNAMFTMPPPPIVGPQAKGQSQPGMVYHPPDMGLPRPPVPPTTGYVPANMPFYDPRMAQMFPNIPHANRPTFPQPNFYPKRP
ncbi:PREDICTED: H/ACA ribonucleoprotein complex non-core subunit NAF1 isoform X2 [Nicrophorus vespilloides]|uniref:H/ACA ribonucleoprotein complex non-core subunit NAF1 n=1 Tax=Nicrophorus vespilloides TaxID=110193 RepID=A0ABM1N8Y5_NICVS|nr:PREDICTED: H/ACA ribonucleoprotein complex non-core subunit NAF1 isoform X2 [Nicrophorus vespilloides]